VGSGRLEECEVEGRRDRGRPRTRWLDGVKKACNARSLELREAKVVCMDREQWSDAKAATDCVHV